MARRGRAASILTLDISVCDQRTSSGAIIRRFTALKLGLPLGTLIALAVLVAVPAIAPAARPTATGESGLLEPLASPRAHAAQAPTASDPCPDDPNPNSIPFLLGPPQATTNSSGELTSVSQTVAIGYPYDLQLTSPYQCWEILGGNVVAASGSIDVNGVWLVPVSGSPLMLVVPKDGDSDASGTIIEAIGGDTDYYVEVPDNSTDQDNTLGSGPIHNGPIPEYGAPLDIIGQVDIGATPWVFNAATDELGGFSASSNSAAITYGGQAITGGTVTDGGFSQQGMAIAAVNVPLPRAFTTGPSSGSSPTATFDYYTVNANAVLTAGGGAGGGGPAQGGGGGNLPPPTPIQILCQSSTYAQEHSSACNPVHYLYGKRLPAHVDVGQLAPSTARVASSLSGPLTFHVPNLYIGGLPISNVTVTYDPTQDTSCGGLWTGGGTLDIGDYGLDASPPQYGFSVCGNGDDLGGGAALTGDAPIIPGLLDLTELGGTFHGGPTRLTGNATLSVASGLLRIPGCFLVAFADPSSPYTYNSTDLSGTGCYPPSSLQYTGAITSLAAGVAGSVNLTVPVLGSLSLGHGYGFYIYPSYFEFGGGFSESVVIFTISGNVTGALDTATHVYDLEGNLSACLPDSIGCVTLQGLLSSKGVGACGGVSILGVNATVYFAYPWGGSASFGFGCDLGPIQVVVTPAAAASTSARTIQIPKNDPVTSITVTGKGHAPLLQVTGPSGQQASNRATNEAATNDGITIIPLENGHETVIGIAQPAPGAWTITPLDGSAPVTAISFRNGMAAPKIHASVTGTGRTYALHYDVMRRSGQTVTFVERATHVFHVIGTVTAGTGTLAFTPAISPVRDRTIVALVRLDGLPNHNLVVASYTAPPDPRAATPRDLHLGRSGTGLTVSWTAGANATSYLVDLTLSDGRKLLYTSPAGNGSLTIPHVGPGVTAEVSVAGVAADGTLGSATAGKLGPSDLPAKVTHIGTATGKNGLVVRWQQAAGATEYLVRVTLTGATSGQYIAVSKSPQLQPSRALAAIRHGADATITVRAVGSSGLVGPAGVFKYAPQ